MNKKEKKTILIVSGFAPSLINFRGELIQSLILKNNVIATAPYEKETQIKLQEWGVDFIPSPIKRVGLNPLQDINFFFFLVKIIKKNKVNIVLSYTHKSVVYASLASFCAKNVKSYAMITGFGYTFYQQGLKGFLLRFTMHLFFFFSLRNNCKNFFQNTDLLNYFVNNKIVALNKNQILINGSGVNLKKFAKTEVPLEISFLMISRLLIDKGVREFIESANLIKKKYPSIQFNLVGDFDSNPSSITKNELKSLNKLGAVNYLGFKKDVRSAIANCSVYVLPSYGEGMPRTVLEAMAMGRAIITTDTPGCRQSIENNINGFLVPPRNAKILADRMIDFIKNPELIKKMGAKSRIFAEKKFDVQKVNNVIINSIFLEESKVQI